MDRRIPQPPFEFLIPDEMGEAELRLDLRERLRAVAGRAPAYRFEMRHEDGTRLGRIELRVGETQDLLLYTGHIGYRVEPEHRGHRYAARSCRLLIPLAKAHGMTELWITCDPENAPSRRTCELAGGIFEGIVPLPKHHVFYKAGSRSKCRYRLALYEEGERLSNGIAVHDGGD